MDILINIKTVLDSTNQKLQQFSKNLTTSGRSAKTANKDMERYYSSLKKLNNNFSNLGKDANRSSIGLMKMTKGLSGMNQLIGMSKLYFLGKGIAYATQASIDMVETVNMFNVAMGNNAVEANKFVNQMHEAFGMDTTNLQDAVGTFNLLARSMGMTEDNSMTLSTNMTKLATDLSSLRNVPINQVMQDLRSGLVGQTETVYKYGVDITEASLKQEALRQGITKSVRNMTQGEKMALRYSAIIHQTGLAQGDFARTINTPANQLKILNERFITLTRSIGSLFQPVLGAVLPYINAFLQVVTKLIDRLALLFGYQPPEVKNGVVNGVGAIADGAEDASGALEDATKKAKELKNTTLGFDELNVIEQQPKSASGGGTGDSILGGDGGMMLEGYDNMMGSVKSKADGIASAMEKALEAFKQMSLPLVNASWDALKKSAEGLWNALKPFASDIGKGLALFYQNVLVPVGVWLIEKGLPAVVDVLASAFRVLDEVLKACFPAGEGFLKGVLEPLGNFTGDVFVATMEVISAVLDGLAKWISQNQGAVSTMIALLATFFAGWKISELITFLGKAWEVIWAFDQMAVSIGKAIIAKAKDLAATISLGLTYAKDFVMSLAATIGKLWDEVAVWAIVNAAKVTATVQQGLLTASIIAYTTAQGIATGVASAFGAVLTFLSANPIVLIIGAIALLVVGVYELIKHFDTVKATCQTAVKGLQDAWKDVATWFKEHVVDPIVKWWDGLIEKVKEFLFWTDEANDSKSSNKSTGVKTVTKGSVSVPHAASGGSFEAGQLFQAGEFGKAELVGGYNGKTTVMPLANTDFVQAIHDAVYSAMQNSGGNGTVVENVINLDGEVIYKNQQKVASDRGYNFGMGVFAR